MLRTLAAIVVVIAGAIAAAAYFALFVVHVNEQAIVLEFGKPVRIISEPGLYWKIPVVQTVDTFDKRILAALQAERKAILALVHGRELSDEIARKLLREIDLVEARYG